MPSEKSFMNPTLKECYKMLQKTQSQPPPALPVEKKTLEMSCVKNFFNHTNTFDHFLQKIMS